ncbi:hypothetical protein ACLB2K_008959 [Fragaria x ananassa]
MSPIVRPRILVRHCCALQKHKRHRSDGCVMMKKKKKKKIRLSEKVKQTTEKLELEEQEANKTLYLCIHEEHKDESFSFVVHTITLSDFFDREEEEQELQSRQVAYKDIPDLIGCGVFRSQIVIAGGVDPNLAAAGYEWVFDPEIGKWEGLPQPPFFQLNSPYYKLADFSYVTSGTKMLVSQEQCPVFCFDVAHPDREWRLVPTMCSGGPLPFSGPSLVLDLPEQNDINNKKLTFGYNFDTRRLGVYVICLEGNQESMTQIGNVKLPEFGAPGLCDLVHIGGQKGCIDLTRYNPPSDVTPKYKPGTHKTLGMAIPFEHDLDITKVDRDKKNCFTIQFMTPRIFNYHTNPSTFPQPPTVGCFLL